MQMRKNIQSKDNLRSRNHGLPERNVLELFFSTAVARLFIFLLYKVWIQLLHAVGANTVTKSGL